MCESLKVFKLQGAKDWKIGRLEDWRGEPSHPSNQVPTILPTKFFRCCLPSNFFFSRFYNFLPLVVFLVVGLFGCMSPDPEQQKKRELQRDALKLRMGQALNPTDAEGHLELGKIYRELGESEKAIESFQNAIALDDKHEHAYNNLGLVYTDLRLYILAIEMFQVALALSPENPAFSNNLGYAYNMTEQFDEAFTAYHSAIESDPTFVDAYYNLADAYLNRDMYAEAIQSYESALEIEAGDADVYFNLGLAYEENGQFLRAIQSYEKGLSLDDSDVEAYYRLAQAYKKNGDPLMMRRYLETFLDRAKDLPHLEEEVHTAEQLFNR